MAIPRTSNREVTWTGAPDGPPRLDSVVLDRRPTRGSASARAGLHGLAVPDGLVQTLPVGLDGEALIPQAPLEFRTPPGAPRVRLPVTAPGASAPAPYSGPVRTLVLLVRVLAGRTQALT